jgi:hypothetical protein
VIDHEYFNRGSAGFDFQAEFVLQDGDERRRALSSVATSRLNSRLMSNLPVNEMRHHRLRPAAEQAEEFINQFVVRLRACDHCNNRFFSTGFSGR